MCEDDALRSLPQNDEAIERMRSDWNFWLELPTTGEAYNRIDDLDEKIGALETLLLDKSAYNSMYCGDGACLGCGEKTLIHLFTGTVTALMRPRVEKQVARLDDLDRRTGAAYPPETGRRRRSQRLRRPARPRSPRTVT